MSEIEELQQELKLWKEKAKESECGFVIYLMLQVTQPCARQIIPADLNEFCSGCAVQQYKILCSYRIVRRKSNLFGSL
jgi:hypothetical protein